jgi:ABC-type multidrug transport system fused ATPase/permease subunit
MAAAAPGAVMIVIVVVVLLLLMVMMMIVFLLVLVLIVIMASALGHPPTLHRGGCGSQHVLLAGPSGSRSSALRGLAVAQSGGHCGG